MSKFAIVDSENKVTQILYEGQGFITDGRKFGKKWIINNKDIPDNLALIGMHEVITDAQPSYDHETEKVTLNQLKVGDVFVNETWTKLSLTQAEINTMAENVLAAMDSEDMSRAVEDEHNANKAAFATLGVNLDDFTDSYFLSKKAAKEAERAKIIKQ